MGLALLHHEAVPRGSRCVHRVRHLHERVSYSAVSGDNRESQWAAAEIGNKGKPAGGMGHTVGGLAWVVWRRETRRFIQRARACGPHAFSLPVLHHPVTCTFSPSGSGGSSSSTADCRRSYDLTSNTIFASFLTSNPPNFNILFPTDGHLACSPTDGLPPVVAFLRLISLYPPYHIRQRASACALAHHPGQR